MERSTTPRYRPSLEHLVPRTIELIDSSAPRVVPDQRRTLARLSPFDEPSESESEFEGRYTWTKPRTRFRDAQRNSRVLSELREWDHFSQIVHRHSKSLCERPRNNNVSKSAVEIHDHHHALHAKLEQYSGESVFSPDDMALSPTSRLKEASIEPMSNPAKVSPNEVENGNSNENSSSEKEPRDSGSIIRTSRTKGPVINPYPYPERQFEIVNTIAKFDLAFGSGNGSEALDLSNAVAKRATVNARATAELPDTQPDPKVTATPSEGDDLVRDDGKNTRPAYANGSSGGAYNVGNDIAAFSDPIGYAVGFGPMSGNAFGLPGRQEDPDPQDTPGTLASPGSDDDRRFSCVYHHPETPQLDPTPNCKTFHKYVSHLRVHHGGNEHPFYYCTICMTSFATEAAREAHAKHQKCKNLRCVTEGCLNFWTFDTANCNHSGKGRTNSQWSIWEALRRIAPPVRNATNPELTMETSYPAASHPPYHQSSATVTPPVQVRNAVPSGPSGHRLHSLQKSKQTANPTSEESMDRCESQLRMFTRAMMSQLDEPDRDGLDMLHDMYAAYMDHDFSTYIESSQLLGIRTAIQGLLSLNRRLWNVIQRPGEASQCYVQRLRNWALEVLSSQETPANLFGADSAVDKSTDEQQSPTIAALRRSKGKQRQRQAPLRTAHYHDADTFQSPVHGAISFCDAHNHDYEMLNRNAGAFETGYINPSQIHETQDYCGPASYLPFTQTDSAAAIQTPENGRRNLRTTDSGYSTAGYSNRQDS